MTAEKYYDIKKQLVDLGYDDEIDWQTNLKECDNSHDFFGETCWVILNSGMKEQIARKIWERIKRCWNEGGNISGVFRHEGKVKALKYVKENMATLFEGYVMAENKIQFLQTIPFIGKITCYHLAKNLGHDVVKPDRHLVRIANEFETTPDEMCEKLSKETGDKKCVIDIVLWRGANLKLI